MLKSCVWTLAAIGLWIGGLAYVAPHREIWTVESGHPVMRATMPSPAAATWALWLLSAAAGSHAVRAAVRTTRASAT